MQKKPEDNLDLRQKAERRIAQANTVAEDLTGMSAEAIAKLVHELRVHQIELKLQNDELRRIQVELENARDRYLYLYDFAPTAYFTVDEKGVVTEANLTAATLLHRTREDLIDKPFSRYICREDQDLWYLNRKRLLEKGDFQSLQLRLVKSDKRTFFGILECMPTATDSRGVSNRIRIAATDISALKRAEQALQQTNKTLEQRVAQRTAELEQRALQLQKLALELTRAEDRERRRLSMVLHDDLQQMLASLRFKIWDMFPQDNMDSQVREKITELEKDLGESINISRALSKELSPQVLYQHGLMAALAWLAKDMQVRHGLMVTLETDPQAEPKSAVLASMLYRGVNELLFNVVKHSGVRSAHVDARQKDGLIVIRVSDSGKGFDYDAFLDGLNGDDAFGLFSIKERISLLGGFFSIDSSPGAGCRATLSLPKGESAPVEADEAPSVVRAVLRPVPDIRMSSFGGREIRIIIADDHPTMREGLANMLKNKNNLKVIAFANNGQEAVSLAKDLNPDLILMDVSMPVLNGIQATAQISRVQPDICIVGISMHDDVTTRDRMLSAGATDHLCKLSPTPVLIDAILLAAARCSKMNELS